MGTVKVRDIMSSPPIAVRPDATVRELAQIMADNNISGVPVVDEEGFLLGMVSEEDLILQDAELHFPHYLQIFDGVIFVESIRKFEERFKKAFAAKVEDVMDTDPLTVSPDTELREVATLMADKDVNRLPVVDDEGRVVGVVARGDVLRAIAALQGATGTQGEWGESSDSGAQ